MKTLATLIRHGITYLVGLLVAWFALHLAAPEDLKSATDAANALVEPLVIVAGFVAVILSRLLLTWAGNLFRRGAGETTGSGTPLLVALGVGTAAVGFLPSCSLPGASASEYPVSGFVAYTDPNTGAQVGMTVGTPAKAKKAKPVKVRKPAVVDAQSGK